MTTLVAALIRTLASSVHHLQTLSLTAAERASSGDAYGSSMMRVSAPFPVNPESSPTALNDSCASITAHRWRVENAAMDTGFLSLMSGYMVWYSTDRMTARLTSPNAMACVSL